MNASLFLISSQPLDPSAARLAVAGPDCGAVVEFVGTVRDATRGAPVDALDYEVYEPMALKVFAQIAAEVAREHRCRLAIHHRQGRLLPGELSVVLAAAAPHRADAFAGCRAAIEALKAEAPIWKRELRPDGSVWVGLGS